MNGIVLCGGENRRMGGNKAFLDFAGKPLIERIIATLRTVCRDVIVVANEPELYAAYGARVVADAVPVKGSLVGVYSGLKNSPADLNFIVACDMPFLNSAVISFLAGLANEDIDAVVPMVADRCEPLHAVYRRSALAVIEDQIERRNLRISDALARMRVRYVPQQEVSCFDPMLQSFRNINTPQEYQEALCAVSECRSCSSSLSSLS
jgi:molybdopterin-guanine dinucleotide biosynthesis protein A